MDDKVISLKKIPAQSANAVVSPTVTPVAGPPKVLLASVALVISLLGAGWYIYGGALIEALRAPSSLSVSSMATSTLLKGPGTTVSMTAEELLRKVGARIELPANEEPAIAYISDLAPLKDQAFFRKARVGDIVLMYKRSLRAILYDPELDKVIEVAPITLTDK